MKVSIHKNLVMIPKIEIENLMQLSISALMQQL